MFSRPQFLVVLGGELAVPCTSNPLQLGRIPRRGGDVGEQTAGRRRRLGPMQWLLANPARVGRQQR